MDKLYDFTPDVEIYSIDEAFLDLTGLRKTFNCSYEEITERIVKEIKEEILLLKEQVDNPSILEIVNMLVEILDFILENSVQLEEQMVQTLKSGIEYCASPNESIDGDLIIQQLEFTS